MLESLLMFAVVTGVLLAVLAWFSRRARQQQSGHVTQEIGEADRLGTRRPLSQHPVVDPLQCVGCGLCVQACPEDEVLGLVNGVVHVVHGSRCIGHGRCEAACPVGALHVGLGDISARPDIPVLTDHHESSVPGLFVVGELSGIALIRHAVNHGRRAIEEIQRQLVHRPNPDPEMDDVIIVGAGPAGIAASLQAIALGIRHRTLEQGQIGGTVRHYPRRKLVMTQPVELPLHGALRKNEYEKEELEALFREIDEAHPLNVQEGTRLLRIHREPDGFRLETSRGEHRARFVVLALGRRGTPRKLGVPGEESAKVSYRLIDAATYRDADLLVVGGGDSAVEAALALAAQPGNRVVLSYRKQHFFRIKSRNQRRIEPPPDSLQLILGSELRQIHDDRVELTTPEGTLELPNDRVFVFAGGHPPYPLLREAGVGFGAGASS